MVNVVITSNAPQVSRWLEGIRKAHPTAMQAVVAKNGMVLNTLIRKNASGRPGPRKITGQYVSSWQTQTVPVADGVISRVWSEAPQAWRLEKGFWERYDSLGRFYRQPPYPHVMPAVAAVAPMFLRDMRQMIATLSKTRGAYLAPIGVSHDVL